MRKAITIPFFVSIALIIVVFLLFQNLEVFFSGLLNHLSSNARLFAPVSFLVLASDIVLPVPSSIVMYVNGYVLGTFMGALLSFLALALSSTIGYYIGMLALVSVKSKNNAKADQLLEKYGAPIILITRGIPILSEAVCIVCGYNKMSFRKYFALNLLGYLPLCLLYAYCGSLGYDKNTFLISFFCSLLVSALFVLLGKILFKKGKNVS